MSNLLVYNRHTQPSYQTLAWLNLVLLMITLMYQHELWEHAAMPLQNILPQVTSALQISS